MTARSAALDGLRAIAVGMVFLYHAYPSTCPWGAHGVPIFFVLSGFLITRVILADKSEGFLTRLRTFYIRRSLRIFPLYYGTLGALIVTGTVLGTWSHFIYFQNYWVFLHQQYTGSTSHFWSLCVEEQFYLLYPPMLLILPANWRSHGVALALGSSIAFTASLTDAELEFAHLLPTVSGQFLLWGALAALVKHHRVNTWVMKPWVGTVTAVAAGLEFSIQDGSRLIFAGPALAVLVLHLTVGRGYLASVLGSRPLVHIGSISYGIYMFHFPILYLLNISRQAQTHIPVELRPIIGLFLTIGLAEISWKFFEGPLNDRKDRYAPVNAGPHTLRVGG